MFVWGGSRTWRNVCSGVLTSARKRRRRAGRHFAAAPKLPPPCRWPKPGCALPGPVDGPTPDEMPALARHFWICANSAAVGGLIARSTWIRCPPVRKRATIFGTVPSWWTATSMRPCELAETFFAAATWRACFSGKVSCVPGRKKSWTKCVPALPSFERSVSTDWLLAMTSPNPPGPGDCWAARVTVRSVPMLPSGSSAFFWAPSRPRESAEMAMTRAIPSASPRTVRVVRPLRRRSSLRRYRR